MSESRDQLAAIDIEIWKDGWAFYNSFDRWIGVLITSILLSFGAPFWYELLSRLLRLRQVLGEKKPEQGASPSP